MEFIDHTGHIFSLPTYDDKPVAIQYTESDYIFWIKDNPVSINNYYILPIRFLLDYDIYVTKILKFTEDNEEFNGNPLELKISLDSNFYKLIGPKYIQEKIENNKDINEPIEFDLNDFKSELTLDDFYFELNKDSDQNLIVYNGDQKFLMFPFYVIGKSDEEGTYLSNILIDVKSYDQESETQKVVWLNQEQMYDHLMKKTFDEIRIYEYNKDTNEKTLWYTIKSGYNPEINEIITIYQQDYKYRIRNWSFGNIRSDVYHYIYRLPEEKWLQPNKCYIFEGNIFQSCHYCGSVLLYNHDGFMDQNQYYSSSYRYWVPTPNCLFDLDDKPFYPEAYDYNEETKEYVAKQDQMFQYGTIPSKFYTRHSYGDGFTFEKDIVFEPTTTIRDFFFDVDNKDVTENKDGGYIEYTYYKEKNEYTQLTVGCTFIDKCEELIINGKNMGISLPKEIIKAIYSSSFYNKYADEKIFKTKMKELLLNYMSIKGECGNFKSVINSLKWFGWYDKIEISKLIKTDNEFQNQYILDYFNIDTDLKDTYKYFNTTNLISLSIKGNQETGENDLQLYSNILIGEGKPILEDLFNKNIEVRHDDLKFYKPYYDFLFNELALKLDCLSYYWQKYFLPIHLKINRASIEYKVYANDMKLSCAAFRKIVEKPVIVHVDTENMLNVVFPESTKMIYNKSIHYIDSKFNEFSNYNEDFEEEDLYYVNENCIVIPIKIENLNNRFSKNSVGEYFLIDGEYIKPFRFFKYNAIGKYLEEVDDASKADYYQLYYNSEYQEINETYERYSNVTTDYYNCKIFLSYIDNETNEEKYLVQDNNFTFYQTIDQYYCNYIIIPRLISDKSFDWLNTYFRLAIVINNKWFTYDFTIHTPNIYLDLGKLNYRYEIGDNVTMFKQFRLEYGDLKFNSFLYQPDLVSIDTLFYDKDNDKVLTFIQKLIETEGDQNKMYEFYKQYYQKSINIPYNPKYYNKIHIFDIYSSKYNGKGFHKVIIAEYFGWHTWGDEWSEYNGGKQNVIKGWGHLVPDFWNEYPNGMIKFYKNNGEIAIGTSSNLNSMSTWQTLIIDNGFKETNISHIELIDNNGNIVRDLKYIEGELFADLRLIDETDDLSDDAHVNHTHRTIWWYDELIDNNAYDAVIDPDGKLIYSGEEVLKDLYSNFFNLNNANLLKTINENCEYDAYLMHDEPKENTKAYWYMVLISKYPIDNYTESELTIHQETYKFNDFYIKYSGYSFDKFLVNRMDITPSNGYNHFNQDDLVIATINNNNYQFNIDLSSKWTIQRAYDINDETLVISNANMIIIPNNNLNGLYSPGYYNINLDYSINGLNDQLYNINGIYLINNETTNISYPIIHEVIEEKPQISYETVISDFNILYENINDGTRKTTKDILDLSSGFVPIGIKIVNAGYFAKNSPDIYMGLKLMCCGDPDNGFAQAGNKIYKIVDGQKIYEDNPYWGFYNKELNDLQYFNKICYTDETKTEPSDYVYPQTDDWTKIPTNANSTPLYPAPNNRGFYSDPALGYIINLLNDDDTLNRNLLDETCAASDWNGKLNTQKIIAQFGNYQLNWKTDPTITNTYSEYFSPAAACCWRYHTATTNQGDWYLPAFSEVFFITYNFKKYSEIFEQLSTNYPEYCKPDLIKCIGSSALWSSTSCDNTEAWEIHPCAHAHSLSKSTKGWYTIPFIHIDNNDNGNSSTDINIINDPEINRRYDNNFMLKYGQISYLAQHGFNYNRLITRILIEDFTNENPDFDFNDAVFDVEFINENQVNIIPVYISNYNIYIEDNMHHLVMGESFTIEGDFNNNCLNIKVLIKKDNNYYLTNAQQGHYPSKIAVSNDFEPCEEGISIRNKYPNFLDWMQNPDNYNEMDSWYK